MSDAVINIHGYEVILSVCDLERVKAHGWYKNGINGSPYFACKCKGKHISLHRFIVDCPSGMQVDHINGNTLDNRRSNLRVCTKAQNSRNRHTNKNSISGYKGVYWDNHFKKWITYIRFENKKIYLGRFDNPEKAYEAYVAASEKYHGEFGRIA